MSSNLELENSSERAAVEPSKVLIVDDCAQLLEVVAEVLTMHGFAVTPACGAAHAIEALKEQRPDIIICDVMMPGIDGYKFNAEVRQSAEWADIPFIFLTALSEPDDVRYGKALGCDDYLTKPFDPLDLVAIVRGKVALAKTRQLKTDEKLERYRKRVIYTLSHEFRTPLVAINTGTELLLEQEGNLGKDHLKRLLESVHRGGLRLQRLVEDFMTLQQIDSGAAAQTAERLRRRVPVMQLVDRALESFKEYSCEEKLYMELLSPAVEGEEPLCLHVCEIQVINLIHRLLSNAQKFGGVGNLITVNVTMADGAALISIRDRGPGMGQKEIEEALKLFGQINREKFEQQGCGLGLTIAAYYAHINGGRIVFQEPLSGGGLEVAVRFALSSVS